MTKVALLASSLFLFPYCEPPAWLSQAQGRDRPSGVAQAMAREANSPGFLHIEPLSDATPPVFVMRGGPRGPGKLVFIHGMCGHALGYAQSFARSAAKHGALVAPQGDVPCEGSQLAKWSLDTAALDARIVTAFHALGFADPIEDVTAIGYSQGANRVEALARKWPARYTRLVLMAGPTMVSPNGLEVRSAVMMAGTLDRQDLMQASSKAFLAAGRRARYLPLPNARGQLPGVSLTAHESVSTTSMLLFDRPMTSRVQRASHCRADAQPSRESQGLGSQGARRIVATFVTKCTVTVLAELVPVRLRQATQRKDPASGAPIAIVRSMGEKADLSWAESIEKIRHIAEGEVAMMHTFNGRKVGVARPMATAGIDDDGTLWFLSQQHSPKNEHLGSEEVMQLTYSVKSRSEYLVLDGRGSVLRDQVKIDQLWSSFDKTWFPEGKKDPSITLIRFIPEIGHYWDTKHSKMIQLLGMAVGAVTGKPTDDSIEGDVQL